MASEIIRQGAQAYNVLNYLYKHANKLNATATAGQRGGALPALSSMPIIGPVRRSKRTGKIKRVTASWRARQRRKRGGGGKKTISAQKGNYVSNKYRSHHQSGRSYRRELLRTTNFLPHYRSLLTTPFVFNTTNTTGSAAKTGIITVLPFTPAANYFWKTAGGALPIDQGKAVPTFDDSSIVLRGGRSEVTVAVPGVDAIRLRMFKIWINKNAGPTIAGFNAIATVPTMWDITHFVDHQQFCKVLSSKEYIMLPGSRPISWIDTFRARKIDFDAYTTDEESLGYVFTISKVTNITAAVSPVEFSVSHSISFTGDVSI